MPTTSDVSGQDDLYERAAAEHGAALGRLVRGYEADPEKRRELLQEIHLVLWRSFERFQARCSLRTWVYRVAHNTAASWVNRQRLERPHMLRSLEELDDTPVSARGGLTCGPESAHTVNTTLEAVGSAGDSCISPRHGRDRDRRVDVFLIQRITRSISLTG